MRTRHSHPHGLVLGFHLSALDEADRLDRADKARRYAAPMLDQSDDDYEFVSESLERWGDRNSPKDPNWR